MDSNNNNFYEWCGRVCTEFKKENGDTYIVAVSSNNEKSIRLANRFLYNYEIYVKRKGNVYKDLIFKSQNLGCQEYLNFITKQELYESLHNFWWNHNPLRFFSKGSINGELKEFIVNEIKNSTFKILGCVDKFKTR